MKKFDVNNTWFTSDLHFWHKNICTYCNRPYSTIERMNQSIIDNWNKKVGQTDDVFCLGDLGFCGIEKLRALLPKLNGKIHLIQGNHDSDKVVKHLLEEGLIESCEKIATIIMIGDEEIPEQELTLCHFPMVDWANKERGAWMIHGHQHQLPNTPSVSEKHWDVGLDKNYWMPINFETLKINITKQYLYDKSNFKK